MNGGFLGSVPQVVKKLPLTSLLAVCCLYESVRAFETPPFRVSTDVVTGRRTVHDLRKIREPDRIVRAKISVTASKMIMGVQYSKSQIFDLYNFRVRWTEPFDWRDNFNSSSRNFHLICWMEGEKGNIRTIFNRKLNWYFTGYHEKFRFPQDMKIWLQCKVTAINSAGLQAGWRSTNRMPIHTVPIGFPGVPGLDLRGWTNQEIEQVLANIDEAAAAEDYNGE